MNELQMSIILLSVLAGLAVYGLGRLIRDLHSGIFQNDFRYWRSIILYRLRHLIRDKKGRTTFRILWVGVAFLTLVLTFTIGYFVMTPVQSMIMDSFDYITSAIGLTADAQSSYNWVTTVWGYWWIWLPFLVIAIYLAWLVLSSTRKDEESVIYEDGGMFR